MCTSEESRRFASDLCKHARKILTVRKASLFSNLFDGGLAMQQKMSDGPNPDVCQISLRRNILMSEEESI